MAASASASAYGTGGWNNPSSWMHNPSSSGYPYCGNYESIPPQQHLSIPSPYGMVGPPGAYGNVGCMVGGHYHIDRTPRTTLPVDKKRKIDRYWTDIEIAKRELVKAKQHVRDLEALINNLQKQEEAVRSKTILGTTINSNCDKALQGETLCSSLEFLRPKDILSCAQVCRQWNHDIDRNPRVWKKAVENQSPAFARDFVIENDDVSDEEDEGEKKENLTDLARKYKNIAIGLIYRPPSETNTLLKETRNPQDQLDPEDVILLVEIKDQASGKVIGSLHRNLKNEDDVSVHGIIFDLENTGHVEVLPKTLEEGSYEDYFGGDDRNPSNFVPEQIHSSIFITVRCFRRDTAQSYCWIWEGQRDDSWNININERADDSETGSLNSDTVTPDANSDAGDRARQLWSLLRYENMNVCFYYALDQFLPSSSDSIPARNEQDRWQQSRYKFHHYHVMFGIFKFEDRDENDNDVWNMHELMMTLNGLAWR